MSALVLGGCSDPGPDRSELGGTTTEAAAVTATSARPLVPVPTHPSTDTPMQAGITGVLEGDPSTNLLCTWITGEGTRVDIIWPEGSVGEVNGAAVTVTGPFGQVVVVGAEVDLSGGFVEPSTESACFLGDIAWEVGEVIE